MQRPGGTAAARTLVAVRAGINAADCAISCKRLRRKVRGSWLRYARASADIASATASGGDSCDSSHCAAIVALRPLSGAALGSRRSPRPAATIVRLQGMGARISSRRRPRRASRSGTVDAALSGVRYSNATIGSTATRRSSSRASRQFSGRMIPPRMKRAKSKLAKHADTLRPHRAAVRRAEGDRRRDLGAGDGFRRREQQQLVVLSAVATLAYDCRRSDFFRGQLDRRAPHHRARRPDAGADDAAACTARSGRRSSCRRPMSPSRSTSTATAAPT